MSDSHPRSRESRRPRASHSVFLGIAVLVLALVLVAGRQQESHAAGGKVDIVYISVVDEGPTARAWYDGAPSPGVPVQDALNKFAKEGYKVAEITLEVRREAAESSGFVILLQRVGGG